MSMPYVAESSSSVLNKSNIPANHSNYSLFSQIAMSNVIMLSVTQCFRIPRGICRLGQVGSSSETLKDIKELVRQLRFLLARARTRTRLGQVKISQESRGACERLTSNFQIGITQIKQYVYLPSTGALSLSLPSASPRAPFRHAHPAPPHKPKPKPKTKPSPSPSLACRNSNYCHSKKPQTTLI